MTSTGYCSLTGGENYFLRSLSWLFWRDYPHGPARPYLACGFRKSFTPSLTHGLCYKPQAYLPQAVI